MKKKDILAIATAVAALVSCSEIPKQAYYNRGQPESLLDKSSEVVNLRIDSPANVEEITNWVNRDQPTRAELSCSRADGLCGEVESVLHQFGVPVKYSPSLDSKVALIYERIQARDCENRYIDNMINPYNLNHPTFGCTLAVNMVQMVSNKREFTNPELMDNADAIKTGQTIGFYNTPSTYTPAKVSPDFPAIATQQNISSSDAGGTSR